MNPIDKVIFLLIKAGKPELCLSIMRIFPTPSRRKRTSLWGTGFSAWCTRYQVEKITTAHGPEDMVLDLSIEDNPRIIISCSKRKGKEKYGKLQYYNLNDGSIHDLTIEGYDASAMRPHGITTVTLDSVNYLYAISHEDDANNGLIDKIVKFEIDHNRLLFRQQWTSDEVDLFDAANDLVVNEKGMIYCANPTKVGIQKVPAKIGLVYPDGRSEVIADGLYYPNGIYLDENDLYVATAQGHTLYKYQLDTNGKVKEGTKTAMAEIKGGDNITKSGDNLVIAYHPSVFKFVFHARFGTKSPSSVYTYNIRTREVKQIFGPSSKYISASSTGLIYENHLYISQVFENYIIRVQLSEL